MLVFTQSAHDHNIPVSDNKSWLGFKVKNNSLLTFFPSGSAQQKKVCDAAKALWEHEV